MRVARCKDGSPPSTVTQEEAAIDASLQSCDSLLMSKCILRTCLCGQSVVLPAIGRPLMFNLQY